MEKENTSRRNFLKQMLTISVFTAACPHLLKGKIVPKIEQPGGSGTKITGLYSIDLNNYPELGNIWGSVRMSIPQNIDGAVGKYQEIIVSRVPYEDYGVYFSAINTICPHEGNRVYDLNPDLHIFVCSGHGSEFSVMGTYIGGPAAQNLITYQLDWRWKPGDQYLKVSLDFYDPSMGVEDSSSLSYLKKNYPNPFRELTTIPYGIEKAANVRIVISDMSGRIVSTPINGFLAGGNYTLPIDGEKFSAGVYRCSMFVNNELKAAINIVKQ